MTATGWEDPALHAALERIVRRYVDDRIARSLPRKRYGTVSAAALGRSVSVFLDGATDIATPGVWTGEHTPAAGQRVRVLQWPDGDAYVDSWVGADVPAGGGAPDWSIVDAKGDLIAGTAADAVARLAAGADGKVLTADSTQATGLTWSAPLTNPMTTPDDLIKGGSGGAATRLGKGSNGQALSVVAGVLAWANVAHSDLSAVGADDHHAKSHAHSGDGSGSVAHSATTGQTANDHHAQAHVLATGTALGPDHSMSGAAAGEVLRALSGTTAAFDQLQHADLGGVTTDQHHAEVHSLSGADHTGSISSGQHGTIASGDLHPEYATDADLLAAAPLVERGYRRSFLLMGA